MNIYKTGTLHTGSRNNNSVDCVVVGGGMAGISAAIWCSRLGLSVILLDAAESPGGILKHLPNPIEDYPGWQGSGQELASFLAAQLSGAGINLRSKIRATSIGKDCVETVAGSIPTGSVIVATGLRRRHIFPDEEKVAGVYYGSNSRVDEFRDTVTVIVGGGDGAFENAMNLSAVAREVHVVIRRDMIRARPEFVKPALNRKNVFLHFNTVVGDIVGRESIHSVVLKGPEGRWTLEANRLIIKIGFEPVNDLFKGVCGLDGNGFVIVDQEQKTDVEGIWAAGDICTPLDPSLAVCAGQGAIAARSVERYIRNLQLKKV